MAGGSRSSALDGLRGLAALSVLVFHVWAYARPVPGSTLGSLQDKALNEARLGLILFFVLSGFLLYRPWVRARMAGGREPEVGSYLLRRAARILPAYYLALVGSFVLLWGAEGTPGVELPPATSLPLFAVFGQNLTSSSVLTLDPPTWTLAVEASFYVALIAIGAAALRVAPSRAAQASIPLALVAVGLVWNTATGVGLPYDKLLPAALPYFGMGMLAAVLVQDRRIGAASGRALLAAGAAAVVLDGVLHVGVVGGPVREFVSATARNTLSAAGFAAIVAAVAAGVGRNRALSSRPAVALGTVSYGIYLWHLPLLLALRSVGALPLSLLPALATVLSLTVAVATVSWIAVERPVLRWARTARRGQAEGPAAATPLPSPVR